MHAMTCFVRDVSIIIISRAYSKRCSQSSISISLPVSYNYHFYCCATGALVSHWAIAAEDVIFHFTPYYAMDYLKSLASKVFFLVGKVHCRERPGS